MLSIPNKKHGGHLGSRTWTSTRAPHTTLSNRRGSRSGNAVTLTPLSPSTYATGRAGPKFYLKKR